MQITFASASKALAARWQRAVRKTLVVRGQPVALQLLEVGREEARLQPRVLALLVRSTASATRLEYALQV